MATRRSANTVGWTALKVQNFRKFESTGVLEIAPITLLYGTNSSGKSSILRALLLMKQMATSSITGDLSLSGAEVDFGSYKDVVFQHDEKRDIQLQAEYTNTRNSTHFDGLPPNASPEFKELFNKTVIKVTLHWGVSDKQILVKSIHFSSSMDSEPLVKFTRTGPSRFNFTVTGYPSISVDQALSMQSIRAMRYVAKAKPREDYYYFLDYLSFLLVMTMQSAFESIRHIVPLRDAPSRAYRLEQIGTPSAGVTVEALRKTGAAGSRINDSLKRLKMAEKIYLDKLAPGFVAISLVDPNSSRIDNLSDVGFGVSQVLPLITAMATVDTGSTMLIEQPEVHLHPAAQAELADILVDIATERKLTLVIESHSEHILLRIRRRIAENRTPRDKVALYFFERGKISKSEIDDYGRVSRMPDGFFEEDWVDLQAITKAGANRSRRESLKAGKDLRSETK
jgi:predicted ATPase